MKFKIIIISMIFTILVMMQVCMVGEQDIDYLVNEFVAVDIYCIVVGMIIFKDILHPYFVFLYLFNMFLGSRIIIDFLGGDSFAYTTFLSLYKFPESVQKNMLMMCIVSLIAFNLGVMLVNYIIKDKYRTLERNEKVINYMIAGMLVCFGPAVAYYYNRMQAALEEGYGVGSILVAQAYSSPLQYFANFLLLFYYIFLSAGPNKKQFYIVTFFQIIVLIISIMGGERGTFALNISLILVYHSIYIKKINWKIIATIAISLILIFEFINDTRSTNDYSNINLSANDMIREFFVHQGVSVTVLGYADQFKDEYGGCSDVLYPIVNFVGDHFIAGYNENYKSDIDFAHKISKISNQSSYYAGHGAGTSYVAELYSAWGYIGVFCGSMFIGMLMLIIMKKYAYTMYGTFVFLILLKVMFWMPRGSYLSWLTEGVRFTLYIYIILQVLKCIEKTLVEK